MSARWPLLLIYGIYAVILFVLWPIFQYSLLYADEPFLGSAFYDFTYVFLWLYPATFFITALVCLINGPKRISYYVAILPFLNAILFLFLPLFGDLIFY